MDSLHENLYTGWAINPDTITEEMNYDNNLSSSAKYEFKNMEHMPLIFFKTKDVLLKG